MFDLAFSFSTVSRALQAMHFVTAARASAFEGRLKHYQKMGFPPGTRTGRGRAAVYRVDHAIKLALALECNQLGLAPERTAWILNENMYRFKSALRLTIGHKDNVDAVTTFVYFDPSNLIDLSDPKHSDPADMSFHYAGRGQLRESINSWGIEGPRRLALINVSSMIVDLVSELSRESGYDNQEILADMSAWADDHGDDT